MTLSFILGTGHLTKLNVVGVAVQFRLHFSEAQIKVHNVKHKLLYL